MDSDWLGGLVDRYAAALELYARQWCGAPEDVVQEAFLKLVAQRPRPDQPGAWLFRVVRNGAINAAVAARRRRHHEAEAAGEFASWFDGTGAEPGNAGAGCRGGVGRASVAAAGAARGDRRSSVGWAYFRADRRVNGVLFEHSSSILHRGAFRDPGTIGGHMPQIPPDPELKVIESILGELVPRSSRLDRDKLMFQAGAMSSRGARRRAWVWPAITAVLGAVLCGESIFLAGRPAPQVVERVVFVPAPGSAAVASSAGASPPIAGQAVQPVADELGGGGRTSAGQLLGGCFRLPAVSGDGHALRAGCDPGAFPRGTFRWRRPTSQRHGTRPCRSAAEHRASEDPQTGRSLMSRRYVLLGFMAAAAMASFTRVRAQEEAEKPTQIVLRPAAAPVPALKYQLLPERRTLVPGNAAIFYHRAIEMSMGRQAREQRGEKTADGSGKEWKGVVDWANGPLSSIPRDRVKRLLEAEPQFSCGDRAGSPAPVVRLGLRGTAGSC